MRRGLALFAALALLAAAPAAAAKPSAAPEEKQRYLLAQVSVTVRGWLRLEGYRQAGDPMTESEAIARVRETYPELTPDDARPLAFLLVMSAAKEDAATARAHTGEWSAVVGDMMQKTSDVAPRSVRQLR